MYLAKGYRGGVSSQTQSRFEHATWSLAMFVRSHRSLRLLAPQRSSSLCSLRLLACSVHGLAHSLCSLPRGTVKILEYVFTLLSRFMGSNAFFIFTRNTPLPWLSIFSPFFEDACSSPTSFVCKFVNKNASIVWEGAAASPVSCTA